MIDNYNLIITTNIIISLNTNYKILYNENIFNILNIRFYQNSYIPATFYYQSDLLSINVFLPENTNNYNFINSDIKCRYYFVAKNTIRYLRYSK